MKLFLLLLLLTFCGGAYAQSDAIVPGHDQEYFKKLYGNDAARLFEDVLLKNMQAYFANVNVIVLKMY